MLQFIGDLAEGEFFKVVEGEDGSVGFGQSVDDGEDVEFRFVFEGEVMWRVVWMVRLCVVVELDGFGFWVGGILFQDRQECPSSSLDEEVFVGHISACWVEDFVGMDGGVEGVVEEFSLL